MAYSGRLRWFGISVLALIFLLAISMLAALFISSVKLRKQMAASGKIKTMEELVGPPIPDDQNAAVILRRVFNDMNTASMNKATRTIEMFEISTPEEFSKNPKKAAELIAAVDKAEPLMDLLEQALARPKCRFTRDWSNPIAVLFPEFARMRALSRISTGTAIVRAHQGRMQDAADALDTALRITNVANCEPTLISNLVGNATLKIATARLRLVAAHGDINEQQARMLYDTLSGVDLRTNHTKAMEGERAVGMWLFKEARKSPKDYAMLMAMFSSHLPSTKPERIAYQVMNYAKRPLLGLDQAAYMRVMQINIEASKYSYREAQAKGLTVNENDLPRYAAIAKMAPVFNRTNLSRDLTITEADGSRIFLALLAYKDRFRSYPNDLRELNNKIGWKLPKDIFSGKDFVYNRKGEGFLLYGVGEDMKDNGGKPAKSGYGAGDIVWKLKH